MRFLELKIPPPVVALLLALAAWWLARVTHTRAPPELLRLLLAVALVLLAAAFDLSGLLAFRRARTTINPMKPGASSAMVSGGVYRITRNPMYVGLVLLLCGWSVYLGSPWAWLAPLAFAAYVTRFQIVPEERVLARLFGAEYAAYRARVRRWL